MPVVSPSAPLQLPAGMRATRAVLAMLDILPQQPMQGWTESTVESALQARGVVVNRVTVYRALDRFVQAGLLQRSVDASRVTRYWLRSAEGADAVPQLECTRCRQHFSLDQGSAAVQSALQALRQALAHSAGVRNPSIDVAMHGECAQCAQSPE